MTGRSTLRSIRHPLVLLLGSLVGASAASALEVNVDPPAGTWLDAVRVVVTDTRGTSCGSSAFALGEPEFARLIDNTYRITLRLEEQCPLVAPPTVQTIAVSRDLGRLVAGAYTVRVADAASGRLAEVAFKVYEVGTERLELPALATDRDAGKLRVRAIGFDADAVVNDGGVLRVFVRTCSIPFPIPEPPPQPPPTVIDAEVPLPALAAGDYEVRLETGCGWPAFEHIQPPVLPALVRAHLHVWRADGCLPDETTLCLRDGRFRVTATWRAFDGSSGVAHAAPLAGNDGSGLLWFFDAANPELTLKAIDGCGLNQRWWVFLASGSNVAYEVTVTDTVSGAERKYVNSLGTLPPLVTDVEAFSSCGG